MAVYGTRFDHSIANINILKRTLEKGIQAKIIDERNEIELVNKEKILKKDNRYKYISILPLTTEATKVTLEGFKYKLNNYTLTIGTSLGVSNEQIDEEAKITLEKGILIVIKSKD